MVADEPTTALDVTMHPPILHLIAEMQKSHGTAVIFITHDLRLAAARLCDDVVVRLYAGRAVESGSCAHGGGAQVAVAALWR